MMRVGFAWVDISCAPGTPLGGNAREDKAARGVHDPIRATVATIDTGNGPRALVGLDLLAAPRPIVEAITSAIESRTGIGPDHVAVSATHTHSGPDVNRGSGFDLHDYSMVEQWQKQVVPFIADAAAEALATAVPAHLRVVRDDVGELPFNRRLVDRAGATRMNWEPVDPAAIIGERGPIDPELLVLTFSDEQGSAIGAIVHYTLHPAVLVGHDWLVSADYVAETRALVSDYLDGAPVLFANGAMGNINHLNYRIRERTTGFKEAGRIGAVLGEAAVAALKKPRAVDEGPGADDRQGEDWRSLTITLDQRTVGRRALERAATVISENEGRPVDAVDGIPEAAYARWTLSRGRTLAPLLDVTVTIVRLERVVLVYVPFEVFVEFGLKLRQAFPHHIVRVVSLGGDYLGYLPTADAFAEGGYETTFGTSTIAPGQGEYLFHHITTAARAMLEPGSGEFS